MPVRPSTVRAKLTALVALSVVVMFAALPVLSWLFHTQLVDEADDRVTDAEKAFQTGDRHSKALRPAVGLT